MGIYRRNLSKLIDMLSVRFKFHNIYEIKKFNFSDTYVYNINGFKFLSDVSKLKPHDEYLNILCYEHNNRYDYHGYMFKPLIPTNDIFTDEFDGKIDNSHDIFVDELFCVELTSSEKRFLKTKLSK